MTNATKSVMTGGCQCGAVRYALMSEPTQPASAIAACARRPSAITLRRSPACGMDLVWTQGQPASSRVRTPSSAASAGLRHAADLSLSGARPHLRLDRQPRRAGPGYAGDPVRDREQASRLREASYPARGADGRLRDAGGDGEWPRASIRTTIEGSLLDVIAGLVPAIPIREAPSLIKARWPGQARP